MSCTACVFLQHSLVCCIYYVVFFLISMFRPPYKSAFNSVIIMFMLSLSLCYRPANVHIVVDYLYMASMTCPCFSVLDTNVLATLKNQIAPFNKIRNYEISF